MTPDEMRRYKREWVARRRAEWLADKECAECGVAEGLEVDHIDRAQKVSHRIWSWARERRDAELAKCQVLCRPCHKAKTLEDVYGGLRPCGTTTAWGRGCRCDDCRGAHAEAMRLWRLSA